MKAKTIKSVLKKKFDEWCSSIEAENIRELVKKNTVITGGCIASMLLNEKVNDFDVYFTDKETTKAVALYYVSKFKTKEDADIPITISVKEEEDGRISIVVRSAGVANENGTTKPYAYFEQRADDEAGEYIGEVMDDPGEIQDTYEDIEEAAQNTETKPAYRPIFLSTNAITLSNKIQIVLRFYGDANTIHENYDFVHCTNYWTSADNHLELRKEALEALLTKELIYVGSKYPVASAIRLRKFIRRGFTVNAGQILKILMQVSALDLTSISVLQDQLTGVDCAYFLQVIEKLKEKDPQKVNTAYLIEIIDRMF